MLMITRVTWEMASKSVGTCLAKLSCDACWRRMQTKPAYPLMKLSVHCKHIFQYSIRLRADQFTKHNCDSDAIIHSCDTIASLICFAIKHT